MDSKLETRMASPRFRDTGRFKRLDAPTRTCTPANLRDLMHCLDPAGKAVTPIRIRGAGTAATDCNHSSSGTLVDMTGLDRILRIDPHNRTVTAEAGVRLGALVAELAEEGLELVGNHDQMERTLGGAIASPCVGAGIGGKAAYLSTQLVSLKVVTAGGKLMKVTPQQQHLLNAFRLSYGLLGAICEVTLRVRPIATFTANHRSMDIDTLANVANRLAAADVGQKFYLLPHRDRVYLDLRRYDAAPGNAYDTPWKLKDWGESTVLPQVFKSLNRVMPIASVRYRLMDSISAATHDLVNSRLVRNGTNATATGSRRRRKPRKLQQSTWCFPASDFAVVIKAFREFCRNTFEESGYRTDLPVIGYRLGRDTSALLSPSFDEPLVALQVSSTQERGWEDFVIDLAQFAESWGGMPLFSHSRSMTVEHARQTYGNRLAFFRKIRRQLDPHGRLLNPFLAQFFD
jgi:FAD/FMN-containing dehydrogenase